VYLIATLGPKLGLVLSTTYGKSPRDPVRFTGHPGNKFILLFERGVLLTGYYYAGFQVSELKRVLLETIEVSPYDKRRNVTRPPETEAHE
jgi:hypothetical protein